MCKMRFRGKEVRKETITNHKCKLFEGNLQNIFLKILHPLKQKYQHVHIYKIYKHLKGKRFNAVIAAL